MDNMTQADTSIVAVYDHHYASNSTVEKEWTELGSYSRLHNTLKVIKDHQFDSTISVYTPSLFRFLLKSEGFSIISEHLSDNSWQSQKFMITHSKKSINKDLRLFKAQLSNLKRNLVRLFASQQYNQEFSYNAYTCFCEFKAKPEIGYDQVNLW